MKQEDLRKQAYGPYSIIKVCLCCNGTSQCVISKMHVAVVMKTRHANGNRTNGTILDSIIYQPHLSLNLEILLSSRARRLGWREKRTYRAEEQRCSKS